MIKEQKAISLISLVITIVILLILSGVLIYNAQDSNYIERLTNLNNDIQLLRDKVSEYYNEYGKIPAKIQYTETSNLSNVLSSKNDIGNFYVIDLEAMQGITLNYGKDFEKIKIDSTNANNYKDVYIINENSHNIFYVQGITIKENNTTKIYYTNYQTPDNTTVDLRYIDGKLIPKGFYYIGEHNDGSGNINIVISNIKEEAVSITKENQYIWIDQITELTSVPATVTLIEGQAEEEFLYSVNVNKGYFKNNNGKVQYIIINKEKWSETYTKEAEYKDENGDIAYIPKDFKVNLAPTKNKIEKGLVVKDSKENEFVWIPVPKKIYETAQSETDYQNIYEDMKKYVGVYDKGSSTQEFSNWKDEWYNGCGIEEETYTNLKKQMLSSIYTNGGFYIGRYEVGDKTATEAGISRTEVSGTSGEAVIQKNMYPYNYISCSQAQSLSNKIEVENRTCSLLFGIQWDLVCKFLELNGDWDISENSSSYYINTNSSGWGNYSNVGNYKITQGLYLRKDETDWSSTISYNKEVDKTVLLTTGATDRNSALQIFDFAGNVWEWTLEKAISEESLNSSNRGGGCGFSGDEATASYRSANISTDKLFSLGFRICIF